MLGLFIVIPLLDFQWAMAVGDHGLNLYVFQQTAQGATPYQDFWWAYGPLFPYYFAGFMNMFGQNIESVLLGRMTLVFLSGIFCYLTLARLIHPFIALTASAYFWIYFPDFFYSYNHTGIITMFFVITWLLFSYYKKQRSIYIYVGFICLFLMALARINMAFGLLFGFVVVLGVTDSFIHKNSSIRQIAQYVLCALAVVIGTIVVYWLMLRGLPEYAIHQCLPYFSTAYTSSENPTLAQGKYSFYAGMIIMFIKQSPKYFVLMMMLFLTQIALIMVLLKPADKSNSKQPLLFALGTIIFLGFIVAHEFIIGYQLYRSYWIIPYQILFFAVCLHFSTQQIRPWLRHSLCFAIFVIAFSDIVQTDQHIKHLKTPGQLFQTPYGKTYLNNQSQWMRTVEQASAYLNSHLEPDELFFAAPYEPMYYFLTNRRSPSWHVLLMQGTHLTPEQEQQMLTDLKNPDIRFVVLSNRYRTKEPNMGVLGETHLIELAAYINDHFQTAETFGPWDKEAGWNGNHSVKILKRLTDQ